MRRSDSTNGPPPSSLVVEGFDPVRERGVEAVLAVGNGYIGTRAALEEHTPASFPLTLVAGTYDPIRPSEEPPPVADAAPTPIAAPDWGALRIWIDKEELRLDHGLCLRHERWLDHDAGTTVRRWHHRLPCGRSVLATFTRLTSLTDRHGALQQVTLLLPDRGAPVRLAAALEVPSVVRQATPYLTRPLLEPPHAALPATIVVRGTQSSIGVAVAQACTLAGDSALEALEGAGHSVDRSRDGLTEWWEWRAEAGITYRWSRMVAVHTSLDAGSAAVAAAVRLRPLSPSAVAEDHRVRWRERWEASAVEVDGDDLVHAALQTANHHLLMAANPADDTVSVAARDLNGEIYRGHVMWDTEIYLLPFYSLSWPEAARAMLRYRHRHLPAAKARARRSGYRGVLYPWESAGGAEGTVALDRDWKGNQTEIDTWRRAHHVSAAVAYATWQYWQVTGDDDFFATAGAEMLVETARFWASRIDHDEGGRGHITDIMGPDEYHEHVDDSAYTNWMAAHTLDVGRRTAVWLQRERPDDWRAVQASTGLTSDEVDGWADVAAGVVRGQHPATGLIEEFAGYFTLEDVNPREFGDGDRSLQRALGREGVANTQIVKQADVVLLCHVLADKVGPDAVASNFDYYGPRCDHASSLSRSVHAAVAARLGREDVALDLLHAAASLERGDDIGKAEHGVHIANEGGLWQAVVGGVAGLEVTASNLSITPRLLPGWERVRVPFEWRRRRFVAEVRRAGAGNTDVAVWVGAEGAPLARQQLAAGERLALRAEA